MLVLRVPGIVLLVVAVAAFTWEFVGLVQSGRWSILSVGELWFRIDAASLNLAQAVIQRYLLPVLWDPVIQTVLMWPVWLVAGVPALALLFGDRSKRRSRRPVSRPPSGARR